jgi:serpin B
MAALPLGSLIRLLRQQIGPHVDDGDAALLERFTQRCDELAFATLLGRYGPLVLRVCRQILVQEQDVEDAFQAAFLVLAHKAGSVLAGKPLAPWLHGVACRVAMEARRRNARRRYHEHRGAVVRAEGMPRQQPEDGRTAVLHEEVDRLPAKYRQPLVLCYFDGQTHDQAAARLGWPVGTVRTRLSRGRDLLHRRLVRRGVTLSAAALTTALSQAVATGAVPVALSEGTLKAVMLVAAGDAATAGIPATVTSLVQGVLRTMFLSKFKPLVAVVLLGGVLGLGLGLCWPTNQVTSAAAVAVDPAQVKADLPGVAKGNNQFAFDLYGKLRTEKGNLFLSPYSISTALAMTSAGARGQTLGQMEKTLRFPVEQPRLHAAFGSSLKDTRSGKGFELHLANALWCQSGVPFTDEFLSLNETHYQAKPVGVDFIKETEQARQTINTWVEKQTQDKIKELLKPGVLDPLTRLVLTNAIYFKGDWAGKFDKKLTRDEPFLLAADHQVQVPMMHQTGEFNYLREDLLRAVELPYAGKDLSMVLFVAEQADGLAEFEKTLTAEKLAGWLGKLRPVKGLHVALPRFKATAEFKLNEGLKSLGMSDAFRPDVADFSGVSPAARREGWYISHVIHQACVEVNEDGTEAAGATAVVLRAKSEPPSFRADRPFFFVIRDKRTDSILFMGRVVDPRS